MARAIANCTCEKCGTKFERIQFKATRADAENWKAWTEENIKVCPACYKAEKDEALKEKTASLPALEGSPKQIAWAEKIRAEAFSENKIAKKMAKIIAKDASTVEVFRSRLPEITDKRAHEASEQALEICTNASAKYFIDNRGEFIAY